MVDHGEIELGKVKISEALGSLQILQVNSYPLSFQLEQKLCWFEQNVQEV